ncbi:hypothetical protein SAMN06295912_108102 [Sphingomonas laterariae]|uniref:Cellulose-binding protein n=1 Tax=Edaphosphingomonas laterariae TaxID=861865 RepID=A0A239F8L5_9SPHN|nr:hypothetical protein [Sphingomonas laterariae]SNS52828.1 hypothetical protein SAMN06295912_108102 [Sphingomonas laterariae]
MLTLIVTALMAAGTANASGPIVINPGGIVRLPSPKPVTKTPRPTPPQVAETPKLGVNLAAPTYYSTERAFANLALAGNWASSRPGIAGWQAFDPVQLDPNGEVKYLLPQQSGNRMLIPPETAYGSKPTRIRCTWQGRGTVRAGGWITNQLAGSSATEFDWKPSSAVKSETAWVSLSATDPADPVRKVDCREKAMAADAVWSPVLLESLKGYGVVRFMDWQNANANAPVSWATRPTAETQNQASTMGASVEAMVALANAAGVDPWFAMPWNADEDYQRRFATYVRDNLAPGRKVYVEMANEVWNWGFKVTTQAKDEGMAAGLADNITQAYLWRYAEKSTWMHKIWGQVFAADMKRLVRVIATQNANPWSAEQVITFRDTAQHFDALATAPYFGGSTLTGSRAAITDLDNIFAFMAKDIDETLALAAKNKALAARYGKRYIAYEGGQHVVSTSNVALVAAINRDPRMYDMYRRYLSAWDAQFGDVMALFSTTGPISQFGAWGLREYAGQPVADAPKARAVDDHMRAAK